jgi:DNA-binding XRE family transcriptional regulator
VEAVGRPAAQAVRGGGVSGPGGLGNRKRHAQGYVYRLAAERYAALRAGLARIAWDEYAYDLIGEYPPEKKKLKTTTEVLVRIADRTGMGQDQALQAIDHIESMRPGRVRDSDKVRRNMPGHADHRVRLFRQVHPFRLYRVMKGWSMASMAKSIGVFDTTYVRWETLGLPSLRGVCSTAAALGLSYPDLAYDVAMWEQCADDYSRGDHSGLERWLDHLESLEGE